MVYIAEPIESTVRTHDGEDCEMKKKRESCGEIVGAVVQFLVNKVHSPTIPRAQSTPTALSHADEKSADV